jgi:transcriptional regulator with XRE-family HTH domain
MSFGKTKTKSPMKAVFRNSNYPKLKQLRMLYSFKQEYIADQLGISQSEYSRLENGQRHVKIDDFKKLAQLYRVTPALLMVSEAYAHVDVEKIKAEVIEETNAITKRMMEENAILQSRLDEAIQTTQNLLKAIAGLQNKKPRITHDSYNSKNNSRKTKPKKNIER